MQHRQGICIPQRHSGHSCFLEGDCHRVKLDLFKRGSKNSNFPRSYTFVWSWWKHRNFVLWNVHLTDGYSWRFVRWKVVYQCLAISDTIFSPRMSTDHRTHRDGCYGSDVRPPVQCRWMEEVTKVYLGGEMGNCSDASFPGFMSAICLKNTRGWGQTLLVRLQFALLLISSL